MGGLAAVRCSGFLFLMDDLTPEGAQSSQPGTSGIGYMDFSRGSWFLGIFTVLTLVLSACGGESVVTAAPESSPSTTTSPNLVPTVASIESTFSSEEKVYLESADEAEQLGD